MAWPAIIQKAIALPGGARFYKCALQVNPFGYLKRHAKVTSFADEAAYNEAVIRACLAQQIEVIAVTDHYRVRSAIPLWEAARAAGLQVFPGFEAVTKDGVHFLCLFDLDKSVGALERVLGACGITEDSEESPTGTFDATELLEESRSWGAVCVGAHVASPQGGLLVTLSGQARIKVWRSPHLLAGSLPGSVDSAPENLRSILSNKDANHRRARQVAILNAQDVSDPKDLAKPGASCWIKMSEVSIEGLRQAFLDPESRIRLASDPPPQERVEFVAIAWEGGFLDGASVKFNENLNVLVGGRGTGKSTAVESIRYVLGAEPLGDEARKVHLGIVQSVLRGGTKISLLVRSPHPARREYLIERTIPNPPVIKDEDGRVLDIQSGDVVTKAEVYGQHEISELTRSPEKLTKLLDRFVERDLNIAIRKTKLKRALEDSRVRILRLRKELAATEEELSALPALEERLKQFQQAGIEEKLKDQSLLVSEERVLGTASERLTPVQRIVGELERELPIDRSFVQPEALQGLPGGEILAAADSVLSQLNENLQTVVRDARQALAQADEGLTRVKERWAKRKESVDAELQRILRELQDTKLNGTQFIKLRRQIESLQPLRERQDAHLREVKDQEDLRRAQLVEWEDIKTEEFRLLDRAARSVNRQLAGRVRVQVIFAGDREPLFTLLRRVGGRLSEAIDTLKRRNDLSIKGLSDALRMGREALVDRFGIVSAQADRMAQAPTELVMQVEELELPHTTQIELNLSSDLKAPAWQALEDLSAGQKATAVLLLLLLESEAPLVVDQPEDDLDNRFITEGIVPTIREEKRRRQFLFSTHNANIPVLGDAELIVGLQASGEASRGRAEMPIRHRGSIDSAPVRDLVEEILEGGREAFEMRRLKYGY